MPAQRARERGYIDNRPVFVIILIIAVIAGNHLLEVCGIEPGDLWARVPFVWRSLFWSTLGFIGIGSLIAAITVILDERREPFRVEARGERRVIKVTALAFPVICALFALFGLTLVGYGMAGDGWFSWVALVLGAVLAFVGAVAFGSRRRFVVERGRVLLDPQPAAGAGEPALPQVVRVTRTSSGGAFGQPYVEHNTVWVDDREILNASSQDEADKLAAALKQAIDETAVKTSKETAPDRSA